jgi:hypothetical protein
MSSPLELPADCEYFHPEVGPRVAEAQKGWLLAYLLRDREIFRDGACHLKPEFFDIATEPDCHLLWIAACSLAKRFGEQALFENPTQARNVLEAEAKAYAESHRDEFLPDCWEILFAQPHGLVAWIYSLKPEEMHAPYGRELLIHFLRERSVQEPLRRLVAKADGGVIADFPAIVLDLQQKEQEIDCLQPGIAESIFPEGWEPKTLGLYPTGVPFIDKVMHGQAPGEVYGVLGAYGSGKTTLAVQLVCQTAKTELLAVDSGAKPLEKLRHAFLFHYEASRDEICVRLLSHAAQIPQDKIQQWGKYPLSRAGHLDDYEKMRFASQIEKLGIEKIAGESERLARARLRLQRNVLTADMSGPPGRPAQGSGHIGEIAIELARNARLGRKPGIVVIDYAGVCCDRYLASRNLPYGALRHLLKQFASECRRQIAAPFETPVWIMHQLSGEANSRTHATKQHHTSAADCKSFAENLDFAFNLGTKDETHGALYFTNSKARRCRTGEPVLLVCTFRD